MRCFMCMVKGHKGINDEKLIKINISFSIILFSNKSQANNIKVFSKATTEFGHLSFIPLCEA